MAILPAMAKHIEGVTGPHTSSSICCADSIARSLAPAPTIDLVPMTPDVLFPSMLVSFISTVCMH